MSTPLSHLVIDATPDQSPSSFTDQNQSPSGTPQAHQHPPQPMPLPTATTTSLPSHAIAQTSPGVSTGHTLAGNLYQCADCKKRYSRPEHLARHIQTHTLGKRFSCHICGKAFARADLLKRHTANHANDNDTTKKRRRIDTSPTASRVSHACKACAAARVKCEEMKPCSRCRSRNLACESASAEAASASAMHMAHLPAHAHDASSQSVMQGIPAPQNSLPYYNDAQSTVPSTFSESLALQSNVAKTEEGQPPHPLMMSENTFDPHVYANSMSMTHVPFSDFLREVIYEPEQGQVAQGQGLAVLDYCDNISYELKDIDFGLLDNWHIDGMGERSTATPEEAPQPHNSATNPNQVGETLAKLWMESPWKWSPNHDHRFEETNNLPLPSRDTAAFRESHRQMDRVVPDKLDLSNRDRLLSIVLANCPTNQMRARVASYFPSVDVMDTLIHNFLVENRYSVSSWIHLGTFKLNAQLPEWLAAVAAAGAVMAPVPVLRRFGFAIQEAVRQSIYVKVEDDNSYVRHISLVQALLLEQRIGTWSANRRKVEIAGAHGLAPLSMVRHRGKFHRSSYPVMSVDADDEGEVLDKKWRLWSESESWKRLVFYSFLGDAQTSMTTLTPPLISYGEMTAPLPESKELWFAKTAEEWKSQFLLRSAGQSKRPPCLGDLMRDITFLSTNHQRLDLQYAISIYLHGYWSLIYEWRRLCSAHRWNTFMDSQDGNGLILKLRHQEMCKALRNFQSEWHGALSAQEAMLLNLDFMYLNVSLYDLQLFMGKEGDEQARRVFPMLQRWSETNEARQSLWFAGQILRQAKMFPPGHLKDFYAVGLYQATMTLWTYGVVTRASRNQAATNAMSQGPVYLDGIETPEVQQFVSFGQGRPLIRGPPPSCSSNNRGETQKQSPNNANTDANMNPSPNPSPALEASLDDPRTCMSLAVEVLKTNFKPGKEHLPPIVENLCQLITQLGNAAWIIGLG